MERAAKLKLVGLGTFTAVAAGALGFWTASAVNSAGRAEPAIRRGGGTLVGLSTTNDSSSAGGGAAMVQYAPASSSMAIASYPNGSGGTFEPGLPYMFGSNGTTGTGLHAVGVAYRETGSDSARVDDALIRAAYQDASAQGATLARAAGLTTGKVIAIQDYRTNQPFYANCGIKPMMGAPAPAGNPVKGVAPEPPTPCEPKHYLVAWVSLTLQIL